MISSQIETDLNVLDTIEPGMTYKLMGESIRGYIEDLESLRQSIEKMLGTEQYEFPIYSFDYGIDIASLIGKDPIYVQVELKRRIKECIMQDDRVVSVDNFKMQTAGDILYCDFDILSIFGLINMRKEVIV